LFKFLQGRLTMGEESEVAAVIEAALPEVTSPAAVSGDIPGPLVLLPGKDEVVNAVATIAEPILEAVAAAAEPVVETVAVAAEPVVEAVATAVEPVVEVVATAVEPVVEVVAAAAEPAVEAVSIAAEPVIEAVVAIAEPLLAAVTTPDDSTPVEAPEPLPLLDVIAPIETLDLTPADVCPLLEPVPIPAADPVPAFGDLNALAHGVIHAPFSVGSLNLNASLATKGGAAFAANLALGSRDGTLISALESSHSFFGTDFKMRYTSDRVLEETLNVKDFIFPGLGVELASQFVPDSGKLNVGFASSFSNDLATLSCSVPDNFSCVEASAVIHKSGWLGGILSNVDPKKPGNLAATVALGYKAPDFQAMTIATLSGNQSTKAHIYQQLAPGSEAGIEVDITAGAKPSLALAHKRALGDDTTLAVKIDNSSLVSMAITKGLRAGVLLSLASRFNAMNVAAGPNDFGVGLVIDA